MTFLLLSYSTITEGNLRENGYILGYVFRGMSPLLQGIYHHMAGIDGRREKLLEYVYSSKYDGKQKWGRLLNLKAHPSDVLHPTKLYLPMASKRHH